MPLPVHEDGTDQVAGDPLIGRRAMAEQARLGLSCRDGLLLARLLERVVRRADGVVDRRDLDHLAAEAEADHHLVVEIDRPRRLGRDPLALQARLREDEDLRRLGDVELAEQRPEVAVLRLELELRRSRGEPFLELRDRVARLRRTVVDRGTLDVLAGDRGAGRERRQSHQQDAESSSWQDIHLALRRRSGTCCHRYPRSMASRHPRTDLCRILESMVGCLGWEVAFNLHLESIL